MFNLKDYETVASRVLRFQAKFPNGVIQSRVISHDQEAGLVYCEAKVYRDINDPMPAAIDGAYGIMKTFPSNMQKFYVEDTLSSATGRALSLILEVTHKPTREDMSKVQVPVESDPWTVKEVPQAKPIGEGMQELWDKIEAAGQPQPVFCRKCEEPKQMSWKTGISKTNRPYGKHDCFVCKDIIWYNISPNTGFWSPQESK